MDVARQKLLNEVMAVDFALVDLNLYLNTHPCDRNALAIFVNYVQHARILRNNYERLYGPMTAAAANSYPWPWIKSPWPWEWQ